MKNQQHQVRRLFAHLNLRWFWILVLAILNGFIPAQALTLTLKAHTAVPGKEFFVSDLVQIKDGIPPEILGVRIGSSPTFKDPALITPPMIDMAVKNQVKFPEPIIWEGAASCVVTRPSRFVTAQDLNAVITPALLKLTNGVGTLDIQEFAGLTPMEIPSGHAQASVELNPNAITSEWTNASVAFLVDGEVVLSRSVRFHWSWVRDVWIAQRDIPAGSKVTLDDFKMAQTNALQGNDIVVSDPSQFSRCVLSKPLKTGTVLTQADLEQEKIVYKGGQVMVHYAANGLVIKMIAIAQQDGIQGATIRVMNPTSHIHLLARIIDKDNLEYIQTL